MKRFIVIAVSAFFLTLLPQRAVMAQGALDDICSTTPQAAACRDNARTQGRGSGLYGPDGLLTRVARLLAVAAGISGVFMIMLAGFKYINSGGDPNGVNEAKNMILYAVVGLVFASIAQVFIIFVLNRLPS